MSITLVCGHCGRHFEVPAEQAGRRGRCACGAELAIPAPATLAPPRVSRAQLTNPGQVATVVAGVAGALLGALIAHRYPYSSLSIMFPRQPALAPWTWLLCPLLGLLILRLCAGPRLDPRALTTGLLAGALLGAGVRGGLRVMPTAVPGLVALLGWLTWRVVWIVLAAAMTLVAPAVAWRCQTALSRPESRLGRVVHFLWGIGDATPTNRRWEWAVLLTWGGSALIVLLLAGAPEVSSEPLVMRFFLRSSLGVLAVLGAGLLGVIAKRQAQRLRLGPYAATAAYLGMLVGCWLAPTLWRPGPALAGAVLVLAPALAALGMVAGTLLSRRAPAGSRTLDAVVAIGVALMVIIAVVAFTPAVQVGVVTGMLRQGRHGEITAESLAPLQGAAGARALLALLDDADGKVRQAAAEALMNVGPGANGVLLDSLARPPNSRRVVVISLLARSGEARAVEPLLELLQKGPPPAVSSLAVQRRWHRRALLRGRAMAWVRRIPVLGPMLPVAVWLPDSSTSWRVTTPGGRHPDATSTERVRAVAARGLGKLGDRRAVPPLITATGDQAYEVREAAVEALTDLGDPAALPVLRRALLDTTWTVRARAARAMGVFQCRETLPELIAILGEDSSLLAKEAAWALGELGDRRAIRALSEAMPVRKGSAEHAAACYEALCKLGAPALDPLVAAAAQDWDASLAHLARRELHNRYPEQAVPRLAALLSQPEAGEPAARALREIGTTQALAALSAHGLPERSDGN